MKKILSVISDSVEAIFFTISAPNTLKRKFASTKVKISA